MTIRTGFDTHVPEQKNVRAALFLMGDGDILQLSAAGSTELVVRWFCHGVSQVSELPSVLLASYSRTIAMKASGAIMVMSSYCCNVRRSRSRVTIYAAWAR